MRHPTMTLAIVLAFITGNAALAAAANAPHGAHADHNSASHRDPHRAAGARPSFDALDGNRDGRLDRAELARHPLAAHAVMADADRNGTLDRREFATLSAM